MSVAVLRAENTLLRDQVGHLQEQNARLADMLDKQRTRLTDLLTAEKDQRALDLQHYHDTRLALINSIGTKVDGLIVSHNQSRTEILSQLRHLEGNITKPPSQTKKHGFAITRRELNDDLHELRFIAGQSEYVVRTARNDQGEVIIPFTANGNPIDLRNNFQKEANARATSRFGQVSSFFYLLDLPGLTLLTLAQQEARTRGIFFKCCKSHCTEDFVEEALEEVLQSCIATTDFFNDLSDDYITQ